MVGGSSAESHRRLGDQHPIPRQEQRRTPKSSNANLPPRPCLSLPPSDHDTLTNSIRLHPPPPSVDNNPKYRQHAWCLRPRCRGRQVHQRLRCLLEASGQAANPRSVSTSTQIEKKKRWTNQQYGHEDEHEHTPYAICYATSRGP